MTELSAAFVLEQIAATLDPAMFKDEAEGRRIITRIRDAAANLRLLGTGRTRAGNLDARGRCFP